MQLCRRESEKVAQGIIDALVHNARFQICSRHKWQAVEARVNAWGQERRQNVWAPTSAEVLLYGKHIRLHEENEEHLWV